LTGLPSSDSKTPNPDVGLYYCLDCDTFLFYNGRDGIAGCTNCNSPNIEQIRTRYLPLTEDMYCLLAYLWRELARSELDLDENSEFLATMLGEGAEFKGLHSQED
jgi:hypothetical protein